MSLEETYSDVDPECPKCGTPISEHEANGCLNVWIFDVRYPANEASKKGADAMLARIALRQAIDYLSWEHAGPLLEEMQREFNLDIICYDDGVTLVFPGSLLRAMWAKTIPLVICRGFLHWKANEEAVEES